MATPLTAPPASLLVKLGSIAVHVEELLETGIRYTAPADFDVAALQALLADPELVAWREQMDALALLPAVKRGE